MRALEIKTLSPLVFALLIVAMVGCENTGSGMGESATGDVHAHFTWQQSDPVSGTLTATVSRQNGLEETYEGKFYQITDNSQVDTLGPLWHVLANLTGPGGKCMRCEFSCYGQTRA